MDVPCRLVRLSHLARAGLTAASSDVSRVSDVSVSAYLRTAPSVSGQNRNDMGNDLFLGAVK